MKAMISGLLAMAVIAVLADLTLENAGYGSDEIFVSEAVRLK